jgi:hypothetical protein
MTCKPKKLAQGGAVKMPWMTSPLGMKHSDKESMKEDMTDTMPESKEKAKPKGFKPSRGKKSGCK